MIRFTVLGEPASKANSRKVATVGPADNRRTLFIKSEKARKYERDALRQIPPAARQRIEGPVRVTMMIYYASERPDLDASIVLDCLQDRYHGKGEARELIQRGVIRNDRQVRELHLFHFIDRANPRAEIEVEPMVPQQVAMSLDVPRETEAVPF